MNKDKALSSAAVVIFTGERQTITCQCLVSFRTSRHQFVRTSKFSVEALGNQSKDMGIVKPISSAFNEQTCEEMKNRPLTTAIVIVRQLKLKVGDGGSLLNVTTKAISFTSRLKRRNDRSTYRPSDCQTEF